MDSVFEALKSSPALFFLTAVFLVRIAISGVFILIAVVVLHKPVSRGIMTYPAISEEFLMLVVVAPVSETFLCQYLPVHFLKGKWPDIYIVLLSAILFGCGHFYNWIYFLNALCAGLLYGVVYASKARVGKGFLYTATLHTMYNGFAFIINHW